MARKEQDGKRESKSRAAMRQSARAPSAPAPAEAPKTAPAARGKAKERAGCLVAQCTCAHEYQDQKYGSRMRVFNLGHSKGTCTVCGNARSI